MKLFHPTRYKHLRYCLFVLLTAINSLSYSQKIITNPAGEKIIQYDDGTWRYFEGRDSMLESNFWEDQPDSQLPPIDPLPTDQPVEYNYLLFQKYIAAAVRYESEMLDKVDQSSTKVHNLEDQITNLENSGDQVQAEKLKSDLSVLNDQRQNEQRLLSYARSLIKKILKVGKSEKYEKLSKIYVPGLNTEKELNHDDSLLLARTDERKISPVDIENATQTNPSEDRDQEDTDHEEMSDSSDLPRQEAMTTKGASPTAISDSAVLSFDQLETQKEEVLESIAQNGANKAESSTDQPVDSAASIPSLNPEESQPGSEQSVAPGDPAVTEKPQQQDETPVRAGKPEELTETEIISKAEDDISSSELEDAPSARESAQIDDLEQEEQPIEAKIDTEEEKESESTKQPGILTDVLTFSGESWISSPNDVVPEYHCEFSFHGIDDFTNTMKKELKEELFFSYTDERLKPYLKESDYVSCQGYLTSISGGFRYLTLIFSIASKNASREYGYVKTGSLLNLKLLDGETVSLFTQSENQGILDPKTGCTTYKVRYPIDYQKEKLLLKSGVDKVRVVWSSGYEDYEVFNIDFFINQLNCLNNK